MGGRQGAAHCQLIGCSLSALHGHLSCPSVPQTGLNEGGKLLWIAPSGGRDRSIDPVTGGLRCSAAGELVALPGVAAAVDPDMLPTPLPVCPPASGVAIQSQTVNLAALSP